MRGSLSKISTLAAALAAGAAAIALCAPAGAAPYFAGKTITVQVPAGAGGSYYLYCEIVQRHLGEHIPGHPEMLIQTMPGGGGASSAAYMAHAAPKDGSLIAMISPGAITVPMWRQVKYDARKFEWLGTVAARSGAVWVWHTHKQIRKFDDLKTHVVTIASTGFASAGSVWPRLINQVLGTRMKLIYGYKGGGSLDLAIENGEAMGRWNYYSGFTGVRPTWIPEKKVIPLIAMGPRDPRLAGVPYLGDMLKKGSLEKKVYRVIDMNLEVGQAFYAPPGTPKKIYDILKKGFAAMLADPATKKDIEAKQIEYSPKSAAEDEKLIAAGFKAATPDVVKEIRAIYVKKSS